MKKNKKDELNKEKKNKFLVILFFIALFIIGFIELKNVGFYNDELTEQDILRMNIREYAELISNDNDLVNYYNNRGIISISDSVEKDHGIAAYLPFSVVLPIGRFSDQILSFLWHLYTYTIFFVGCIMFYLIINHLFKNRKLSLISVLIYLFSPRIFADGLYNNKDIVLLSLVLALIYFGILFIEKKQYKNAIILGLIAAFASNVKIIGIFVFGIIGLFYLKDYIIKCIKEKKLDVHDLLVGLLAILVMIITFIAITPAIWGTGKIKLIDYFNWALTNSTKFSRWNGTVLFEGIKYNYAAGQTLPIYYLPKMILITIPIYISLLFFIGIYSLIKDLIRKENSLITNHYLMIALCLIIPIVIALITHTKLYNGWRHFYFIYGLLTLISIKGLVTLLDVVKNKKIVYIFITVVLIYNISGTIIYGINSTGYYNLLVNTKSLEDKYELDYYGVTGKGVLRQALDNSKNKKIYIYSEGYGFSVLENNYYHLSKIGQSRIELVRDKKELNKYKKEGKETYLYYNNTYTGKKMIKGYKRIYTEKAWGNTMSALYS